ncbi:MAG: terminase [Nitrospirae bacterium]|nr:terminase [Nitrospirota bacterium]
MRVSLHAKQSEAFLSHATELLYGGAAGGGKSFLLRVSGIRWCLEVPGIQVYLFRRTHPDLRANHLRGPGNLHELLAPLAGAGQVAWREQQAEFRFASGSVLKLAHLQHETDVARYQGAEIHVLLIDELTHFSEAQYRFLRSRVRRAGLKVPVRHAGLLPRIECASNPGSVGHAWVKAAWVAPAEPGRVWRARPEEGGMRRQYIPARLADNPTLLAQDPEYLERLSGLGAPELVRALRDGDWDIAAGQALELFDRQRHVLAPFAVPAHWPRFRALDWGSSKPFSVGWWAVAGGAPLPGGASLPGGACLPAGALVRYREWYGWDGRPDRGLRLTSTQVAQGILAREKGEKIAYGVADPAIFGQHDGPSVAEHMAAAGVILRRAANNRKAGYQEVRRRLEGEDGRPMLYVFSSCLDGFLRTVPELPLDPADPEDVDSAAEDHAYDETRYACMSRPQAPARATANPAADRWHQAFCEKETIGWKTA